MNPSLLLGPGDDRLSSTRPIVQFLARDIPLMPAGGLNVVDARDVAALLPVAMARGTPGERYLLGARQLDVRRVLRPARAPDEDRRPDAEDRGRSSRMLAARAQAALLEKMGRKVPVDPESVEMARYFWYLDAGKAARELGLLPRDPADTLRDTVDYIRERVLGNGAFKRTAVA